MDGDPVTGEPSEPTEQITFAEMLTRLCPHYMAMGMTYDQFWNTNTRAHKAYRDAYELRQKNDEWDRWRRGAYVYDAILRLSPVLRASFGKGKVEPIKYPDEPWPLTQKEADEREEAERASRFKNFMATLEKESEKGGK